MVTSLRFDEKLFFRGVVLLILLSGAVAWMGGCTYYRDPRAEVVVTSNRDDATIYLVPYEEELPKPLNSQALKPHYLGTTSSRGGVWVHHGYYWIILEKDGTWSDPVEFEVRLDYLNKIYVEF
ncbi:MAG: hypothetical protein JSW58_06895 [Candidatus Latescibacterota bacterium]|nr:MAG: hypothetical protein JSW58_06895 [Candidatus Latescibacterota bacterium]